MSPLPSTPYELFYFTKRKVHPDCHLQHNKNYYSVPYIFVRREVDVKFNSRMALEFERINYDNIKRFAKNYKRQKDNTCCRPPRRQLEFIFSQQGDIHERDRRSCQ